MEARDYNDNVTDAIADIRVAHYNDDRIRDPFGDRSTLPWQIYHHARNVVLEACKKHGTVGPSGTTNTDRQASEPKPGDAGEGCETPDFWIVSDQYNHERYIYVSVQNPECISREWLSSVCAALSRLESWAICIDNVKAGYVIIFPFIMLVTGATFRECHSVQAVLHAMQKDLRT